MLYRYKQIENRFIRVIDLFCLGFIDALFAVKSYRRELSFISYLIKLIGKAFALDQFSPDGRKLYIQDKNGKAAVMAVNDTEFVLRGIDIKIKFIVANGEKASGLLFKLMGLREFSAERVQ